MHEIAEAEERLLRGRAHVARARERLDRVEQARALAIGGGDELLDGRIADLARGHVDDAEQIDVALRVRDDAQVRERVLHLGALEEAHAADHLVRDAVLAELLLEHAGLRVHPVEHGDLARGHAALHERADPLDDELRLVVLVLGGDDAHGLAARVRRPELLRLALLRRLDDAERGLHDVAARAVVLLELHDLGAREIPAEAAHDAHVGAAPAVDALVVVADHAEVLRRAGERPHDAVLHLVHVLELVDEHVAEAPPHLVAGDALGVLEHAQHVEEQVVEIDGVRLLEEPLVRLEALHDRRVGEVLLVVLGGAEALLLRGVDAREHLPRRVALVVVLELLQDARHHGALIAVVVDDEAPLEPGGGVVAAEQARARRVERADGEILRDVVAEQRREARAHLARGLVGEGDREDAVRRHVVRRDEVRDAVDDDARLAAARAGEDEQRPVDVLDRADLRRVELRLRRAARLEIRPRDDLHALFATTSPRARGATTARRRARRAAW